MNNHERAILGAKERWHPTVPKATHSGVLVIGNVTLDCDVLEDGRRILRRKTFLKAMGKSAVGKYDFERGKSLNLPVFLTATNLKTYLGGVLKEKGDFTIYYKGIGGQKYLGYEASILPEVCKVYARAEDDGVLQDNQKKIAKVCRIMLYGLANVGIISLIDDATNYVEKRNRTELERILEKYIAEELRKWTKKFPDEFFKQVYRIHGWDYAKISNLHPSYTGKFINKYVYDKMPPGVLEELKKKNPANENGNRRFRLHQFLSDDIGNDNIKKQITQVVTLMKVSNNVEDFKNLIEKLNE